MSPNSRLDADGALIKFPVAALVDPLTVVVEVQAEVEAIGVVVFAPEISNSVLLQMLPVLDPLLLTVSALVAFATAQKPVRTPPVPPQPVPKIAVHVRLCESALGEVQATSVPTVLQVSTSKWPLVTLIDPVVTAVDELQVPLP